MAWSGELLARDVDMMFGMQDIHGLKTQRIRLIFYFKSSI